MVAGSYNGVCQLGFVTLVRVWRPLFFYFPPLVSALVPTGCMLHTRMCALAGAPTYADERPQIPVGGATFKWPNPYPCQPAFAFQKLEQMVAALQNIAAKGRGTKSVVNFSFSMYKDVNPSFDNAFGTSNVTSMPTLL
jgi:hypothetical protein